jgi:hypothetical protein
VPPSKRQKIGLRVAHFALTFSPLSSFKRRNLIGTQGTWISSGLFILMYESSALTLLYRTALLRPSHFLMPSTSVALTPGLASFLKSLNTNPIETSIENLISCASLCVIATQADKQLANKGTFLSDYSSAVKSAILDHVPPQPHTCSGECFQHVVHPSP